VKPPSDTVLPKIYILGVAEANMAIGLIQSVYGIQWLSFLKNIFFGLTKWRVKGQWGLIFVV
jgi:hypothetical protein